MDLGEIIKVYVRFLVGMSLLAGLVVGGCIGGCVGIAHAVQPPPAPADAGQQVTITGVVSLPGYQNSIAQYVLTTIITNNGQPEPQSYLLLPPKVQIVVLDVNDALARLVGHQVTVTGVAYNQKLLYIEKIDPVYLPETQVLSPIPYPTETNSEALGRVCPHIIIDGVMCDYDPRIKWFRDSKWQQKVVWLEYGGDANTPPHRAMLQRSGPGIHPLEITRDPADFKAPQAPSSPTPKRSET